MIARTYSTSRFNWDKESRSFTACASDLNWPALQAAGSFTLISTKTGRAVEVQLSRVNYSDDSDAELTHWEYRPNSNEHNFKVVVFND